MIITISGSAGSGKSTLAKKLATTLGWKYYSIGNIRRQKAKKIGLTLAEYNKLGETDPSTDLSVDNYQTKLGQKYDNFIIEGRTSYYFIPHSFKIYLDTEDKVAAQRIFNDLIKSPDRNEDKKIKTLKDTLQSIRARKKSDIKRYKQYFNINVFDHKNYDYVLDTSHLTPQEIFTKIFKLISKKIK